MASDKYLNLNRLKQFLEKLKSIFATKDVATTTANGLLTSTDKLKLDGIAAGANKYVHPTTTGNKHIPSGGTSGQILVWSANGTAKWGNNSGSGISEMIQAQEPDSQSKGDYWVQEYN